jgi:hypothetical protein
MGQLLHGSARTTAARWLQLLLVALATRCMRAVSNASATVKPGRMVVRWRASPRRAHRREPWRLPPFRDAYRGSGYPFTRPCRERMGRLLTALWTPSRVICREPCTTMR